MASLVLDAGDLGDAPQLLAAFTVKDLRTRGTVAPE